MNVSDILGVEEEIKIHKTYHIRHNFRVYRIEKVYSEDKHLQAVYLLDSLGIRLNNPTLLAELDLQLNKISF
jgi:hypothetical protein